MVANIAIIAMPEHGHIMRAIAVARGLTRSGGKVFFFTSSRHAELVENTGAIFCDLFKNRSLDSADNESVPIPSRYVSFAACYAESIAKELKSLNVELIIHDAFAVIGLPAAKILGVSRVAICAGHNMPPAETVTQLQRDPRVRTSNACQRAVEHLKSRYGILNASPFSYFDSLSPRLNILSEPPEFLEDSERIPFAPYVFFGSLDHPFYQQYSTLRSPVKSKQTVRVYCSFGTVAGRYFRGKIDNVVDCIIRAAIRLPNLHFVISGGGYDLSPETLLPLNVSIRRFVDQPITLGQSDVYITHHGLNSTHESIYLQTPMISFPFFADQPKLAKRCQELGLAIPLKRDEKESVTEHDITAAIDCTLDNFDSMQAKLWEARQWEIQVVESRRSAVQEILGCI